MAFGGRAERRDSMDSITKKRNRQDYAAAPNYPATVEELDQICERHPCLRIARGGERQEPIGRTLQRAIDREPKRLPDRFVARLAASIVEDPVTFGRLFGHALRAAGREGRVDG